MQQLLKILVPLINGFINKSKAIKDSSVKPVNNSQAVDVKARPIAKDNSPRLKKELDELDKKNPKLADLLTDLCDYVKKEFAKDVTITMIFRTQEEQDEIYKDNEDYQKRRFKSPHQFWHSLDIRSRVFEKEEISKIEDYLNEKYNNSNFYKWTAKCHEVSGHGEHFHIQYYSRMKVT